ncbi:DUF4179 domain-containing protein [Sporosarcina sp. Te-1]|uniref:DUF4179 domain-containing protein n=1 Tax=Sporosarcina sp. Te-1 TaxID=2818390 RepID=UPI001A9DBCED|nr:DUF4179 domain-containing protein [Sporosarcina sp. Te-1]QTD40128.1 DUF4179 domain-containing protein [Sporosarcina sp. Te-1]
MEKWKETIEKQEIPKEPLENAILQGFERAKEKKSKRKRWFRKRGVWTIVAAAVLMLAFITSIRVSPVLASAIASIPGMSAIVDLIQDNKGLQLAIENEHYQTIGGSNESDRFKVTLEGIITDETSLVAFSTIQQKSAHIGHIQNVRLLDQHGVEISKKVSHNTSYPNERTSTNTAELEFESKVPTGELLIEYTIADEPGEEASETIQIPFQVELKPIKKEQYVINKTVEVEGQKIHVRSVTIGSIKTAIEIEYDADNSMRIFGIEDLRLEDEKGEIWTSIQNGVSASGSENPNVNTFYLQSNYFKESDHLTLKFNKLMAMDREEAFIVIDTEKKEVVRQPKDPRFKNLTVNGRFVNIEMLGEAGYHHDPFTTIFDAKGEQLDIVSGTYYSTDDEIIHLGFELSNKAYTNPLRLPLHAYPSYINGNVSIEIK